MYDVKTKVDRYMLTQKKIVDGSNHFLAIFIYKHKYVLQMS